jgi:hypothetical protein
MKTISAVLTKEDLDIIFTTLVEADPEIADSPMTDLFMLLSKLDSEVLITTVDDIDVSELPERIRNLIDKIGNELNDIDNMTDDLPDEGWSTDENSDDVWSTDENPDDEGWTV